MNEMRTPVGIARGGATRGRGGASGVMDVAVAGMEVMLAEVLPVETAPAEESPLEVAPSGTTPVGEGHIAADVEEWLHTQPGTSAPVLWCPRGAVENTLNGVDELAAKVATLADDGAWAVVKRRHGSTWAQGMRVPGGWIVEVNGVPGPECYARRVHSILAGVRRGRRYVRDGGRLMAIYEPRDVVATPVEVAEIIWTWLRGSVAEGFALREIAH